VTKDEAAEAFESLVQMKDFLEELKLTPQQEDYIKTDIINAVKHGWTEGREEMVKEAEGKAFNVDLECDGRGKEIYSVIKLSDLKALLEGSK